LTLAGIFTLFWINGAVGIIGSEDNPANVLYGGVLAALLIGTIVARLEPQGMTRALFATALAQALVPVIALVIWTPEVSSGIVQVFMLNAFFVTLFAASASSSAAPRNGRKNRRIVINTSQFQSRRPCGARHARRRQAARDRLRVPVQGGAKPFRRIG
jgi:hypothetical protein